MCVHVHAYMYVCMWVVYAHECSVYGDQNNSLETLELELWIAVSCWM